MFYSVTFLEPFYHFLAFDKQRVILEGTLLPKDKNFLLTKLNKFPLYSPQILIKENSQSIGDLSYQKVKIDGIFKLFPSCANPGAIDLRKLHFQKRVVGYLENIKIVSSQEGEPWDQLMKYMGKWREKLFKKWNSYLQETSPLFLSLLTGQKTKEFYEQSNLFQEVGVFHIFCVSGSHLGLIGGVILWMSQKFFPYRHFVPLLISILLAFLYLSIANLTPSALRAWIMFSSYLLSLKLGRNTSQISYLLIALLAMFLLDPTIIFDTGTQLSFASTLGIIVFLQEGIRYFTTTNPYLKFIWSSLGITLFTTIFSMPFLLVKGLTFSGLTFIGNLIIAPFLEVILIFSLIIQPLAFLLPSSSPLLGKVLHHLFKALLFATQKVTLLPHFFWNFSIGKEIIKGWLFWLTSVTTLGVFFLLPNNKKAVWLKVTAVPVFACLAFCLSIYFSGLQSQPQVWVLDVGQGLSIAITSKERAVLIDAGGRLSQYGDIGKNVIGRFLNFKNVKKINALFITHIHEDHTNGVKGLIDIFGPSPIFLPPTSKPTFIENTLSTFEVSSYQELPIFRDITLKIFPVEVGSEINNQALVFKICFPSFNILVTGDLEEEGIAELAPYLFNLSSEIIIMPHHGKYLQSLRWLLQKVKPSLAVISYGENNFGHPNPETLSLLNELNIKLVTTQKEGAICFQQTKRGGMKFATQGKFNHF